MESDIEDIEKNLEKKHIYCINDINYQNIQLLLTIYPSKHVLF